MADKAFKFSRHKTTDQMGLYGFCNARRIIMSLSAVYTELLGGPLLTRFKIILLPRTIGQAYRRHHFKKIWRPGGIAGQQSPVFRASSRTFLKVPGLTVSEGSL